MMPDRSPSFLSHSSLRLMRIAIASVLLAAAAACSSRAEDAAPGSAPAVSIPVKAASSASAAADIREMNDYRLNMDDIRKWSAIMTKAQGMKFADNDAGSEPSIDQFQAALDADPKARALIESGGLDTHEFSVITMTMMQSALLEMATAQGANGDSLARSMGITLDNVRFVREHRKEIEALSGK